MIMTSITSGHPQDAPASSLPDVPDLERPWDESEDGTEED